MFIAPHPSSGRPSQGLIIAMISVASITVAASLKRGVIMPRTTGVNSMMYDRQYPSSPKVFDTDRLGFGIR